MTEVIVEAKEYTVEIAGESSVVEVSSPVEVVFDVVGGPGAKGDDGDPGTGVPSGGLAGQVLTKKTDADFDTEWRPSSGGSGVSFLPDPGPTVAPGESVLWIKPSNGSYSLIVRQG